MTQQFAITRAQFEALRTELGEKGFTVAGDVGTLAHDGVEGTFCFDPTKQVLTTEITKKSWFTTMNYVKNQIATAVSNVGGAELDSIG